MAHENPEAVDGTTHEETSAVDANPAAAHAPARVANIVISEDFVARHDVAQIEAYVDAVVQAHAESGSADEETLAAGIRARLDAAGLVLPDESYRNLARQAHDAGSVAISTDGGQVLYGDPALTTDEHVPDVRGSDDPAHPDRPVYS